MDRISKKPPGKRNKVIYSCSNCRKRRVKCDRRQPCQSCIKARINDSCEYAANQQVAAASTASPSLASDISSSLTSVKGLSSSTDMTTSTHGATRRSTKVVKSNASVESLTEEMQQLKNQISTLEEFLKSNNNNSKPNEEGGHNEFSSTSRKDSLDSKKSESSTHVLDLKLDSFKRSVILEKPSRFLYHGPISMYTLVATSFNQDVGILFRKFMEKERVEYKKHSNVSTTNLLNFIHSDSSQDQIVQDIQQYLLPVYDGLLERLIYFRDNLNNLLYMGIVDMNHILECFHKFFKRTGDGGYIFIKPEKYYYYSEISLILSVVIISITSSKFDSQSPLKIPINKTIEAKITELSGKTLGFSKFHRKQTYSALITIVLMKDTFFNFNEHETMDESKYSSLLHSAVEIAYQIGLHRNHTMVTRIPRKKHYNEETYRLPINNSILLWTLLKICDVNYSISLGTPLLINDIFCDVSAPQNSSNSFFIVYLNLGKEASHLINSTSAISVNDIINLRNKFLSFNSSLGTFQELINQRPETSTDQELIVIAHRIKIKLFILRVIMALSTYIRNISANNSLYPISDLTDSNVRILKKQEGFHEFEILKCSILAWCILRDISSNDSVFGNRSFKFLMYFRTHILNVLIPALTTFAVSLTSSSLFQDIRHIFQEGTAGNFEYSNRRGSPLATGTEMGRDDSDSNDDDDPQMMLDKMDYKELELSLDKGNDENTELIGYLKKFKKSFEDPKQGVKLFNYLHYIGSRSPVLTNSYAFFCILKTISIMSCFSDAVLNLHAEKPTKTVTFDKLITQTKNEIEEKMKLGFLDMGLDNPASNDSTIQNWVNSLFDSEVLHRLFPGLSNLIPSAPVESTHRSKTFVSSQSPLISLVPSVPPNLATTGQQQFTVLPAPPTMYHPGFVGLVNTSGSPSSPASPNSHARMIHPPHPPVNYPILQPTMQRYYDLNAANATGSEMYGEDEGEEEPNYEFWPPPQGS